MPKNPIRYKGLDHVVLKVADLDKSIAFYTGPLGMHLERTYDGVGFCHIRCGRNLIDLQMVPESARPEAGKGNVDHICISIDGEVDEVLAYLNEKNVPIKAQPGETYGATGFGTSIYIFDPDSNVIELKVGYAQYPVRTSVEEALKASTRPKSTT
jgi:glyoxylase I family protein